MRFRTWLLVVLAACASAKPTQVTEEPETPAVGASAEDDLGMAFDPTAEAPRAVKGQSPPPIADPRKPFTDAMSARAADQARLLADGLGGVERWKAHELTFSLAQSESAKGDAALTWHRACGPEKLDACRQAAAAAMSRLTIFAKQAAALKAADTCVAQAEAKQKPAPCFGTVSREDDVNTARIALIKALAEPVEARRVAALERLVTKCERVQCATPRRKALTALTAIDLSGKHLEAALSHSLREVAIAAAALPESERPWARSTKADQLCTQFDAASGPGACRKLEKQLNGGWTFRDFSTTRSSFAGLDAEQVKQVNLHYAPPLQACLGEHARRLVAPDQAEFEVRWVVFNDGRVGEVHLPPDFETSPLATCLRRQFSLWRYPRFEGEWQNVAQRFTVTAVTRVQVGQF